MAAEIARTIRWFAESLVNLAGEAGAGVFRHSAMLLLLAGACRAEEVAFHRPVVSPDGSRIAFMSNAGGQWNLYHARVDGSGLVQITQSDAFDGYADYSPDGRQIAFNSFAGDTGRVMIHTIADGQTRALDLGSTRDFSPVWYPDGVHLLFVSERDGNRELYRAKADGSGVTRLTHTAMDEHDARISPDGATIAFAGQEGDLAAVYRMNADGSERRRLSEVGEGVYGIDWSPDGQRLAFNAAFAGNKDLYLMAADGSRLERLTDQPGDDHLPTWSPDGQALFYSAEVNGPERLYRLSLVDRRPVALESLMHSILHH